MNSQCHVITETGRFRSRCRHNATGEDGMCNGHRKAFTRRPYTCRACGTTNLLGPSTCAEHKEV